MYLESLSLTNFRNYASLDLPLGPGTFILWGDNAQGKSNLLEAVYLLATTKSARASNERELLGWGAMDDPLPAARVTGELNSGGEITRLDVGLVAERTELGEESSYSLRKQTRVNGVPRRASDVMGTLNAVLFDPQDVDLGYRASFVTKTLPGRHDFPDEQGLPESAAAVHEDTYAAKPSFEGDQGRDKPDQPAESLGRSPH